MCVSVGAADFGKTTIAGWRFTDDDDTRKHAIIYGNEPQTLSGPNLIILHVPIAPGTVLSEANFLQPAGLSGALASMWAAAPKIQPQGMLGARAMSAPSTISTFQTGSYTWTAATNATAKAIAEALRHISGAPHVGKPLLKWYRAMWPGDALAIGFFNTSAGVPVEPIGMAYEPNNWQRLRLPAVDAHGSVPRLGETVKVNHRIIVGTSELNVGGSIDFYRDLHEVDPRIRAHLPSRVIGMECAGPMPNGDFWFDFDNWENKDFAGHANLIRARGSQPAGELGFPILC